MKFNMTNLPKGSVPMAEYGMFKTAMRGFRKEDVLAYIDELMAEKTKESESFQAQIAQSESQLAEAKVQKAAVEENERLTTEVAQLKNQIAQLTEQLTDTAAKLEEMQGASDAAHARDAELSEQLEQSHQAISALWEEKAVLQNEIDNTKAAFVQLREVGEEFCRQVTALLPQTEETPAAPAVPITEPPLVITEEPRAVDKPMERWLF